jgi:hypothetical protein
VIVFRSRYFNKALDLLIEPEDQDSAEKQTVERDVSMVNDVLALTKQGEAQYASQDYNKAVESFTQVWGLTLLEP